MRWFLRGAALALVTVGALGVVATAAVGEEVVLGTSAPLSGPAAYWGATAKAMEAYARWVNDQGGVHGRRLRVEVRDDGYLPVRAAANVRDLVDRAGIFALVGMVGTANVFAVRDFVLGRGVLWITPQADASIWYGWRKKERLFVAFPSFREEAKVLTRYAVRELGARRLAVFYQNDLYGQRGLLGAKQAAYQERARLVAAVPYEVTETELGAQALRLREAGAEAVLVYATPRHAALLVRAMTRVGYRPKLLASMGLVDPIMFTLGGEAWNDVVAATFITPPGSGDPAVDAAVETVVRYEPSLRGNLFNTAVGVAILEPVVEALRRTGRDLTTERFAAAMESLRNWDGQVVRGVTFGPDRRQGVNQIQLVRMREGRYERLTGWMEYPTGF